MLIRSFDDTYVLIGQTAVPEPDFDKWAEWFETADRVVFQTNIGASFVSTVFLGIDHQWHKGPPLLFETMIFIDGEGEEQKRCSTWAEAEEQHRRVVQKLLRQ